jgi:hypothetical protein
MNPMNRRTRILALATLAVAGLFVMDQAATALWFEPWEKAKQDLSKVELEIAKARTTLAREAALKKEWASFREKLDHPRTPDVNTHFVSHLGEICDRVGVAFEIAGNPVPQQTGDFKEYVYDTKFKLKWSNFVDLLAELHHSREFVKVIRVSVGSQYEREDRLDVELKLSTIEYSPAPVKPGTGARP